MTVVDPLGAVGTTWTFRGCLEARQSTTLQSAARL
jgi:hypothetical protein